MSRVLAWFSAGAASAVATKLALADYGNRVVVARIDPGSEDPDNARFADDCAAWFGVPITLLRSDKYADTWDVFTRTRYLVGPGGARCTGELKKKVRHTFERPNDVHVFGYTAEEADRADRFREQNPGVDLVCPLIDRGLTKEDTLALVERAGIVLPVAYRHGFANANCIACVKATGAGYWNLTRRVYPAEFQRMAELERDLGRTVRRKRNGPGEPSAPLWLDELDPNEGDISTEQQHDCSLMCALAETEISITPATTPSKGNSK